MSLVSWIHCNQCFHQHAKKERKFYHLSCHHVLCKQCMAKTNRGTMCPVCRKPLERFRELNNQMDRKEKMYYDPGALGSAYQSVVFQFKHRENLIKGILHFRHALEQMKTMENALRQRIVETQRRYEKFRTYRRNLQESLRQISPRCGGTSSGPMEMNPAVHGPQLSLHGADPSTSTSHRPRLSNDDIGFTTPRPSHRPSSNVPCFDFIEGNYTQRNNPTRINPQTGSSKRVNLSGLADDSGFCGMQTPTFSAGYERDRRKDPYYQRPSS